MQHHDIHLVTEDIERILTEVEADPDGIPPLNDCYCDTEDYRWFLVKVRGSKPPPNCNSTIESLHVFKGTKVKDAILGNCPFEEASIRSYGWLNTQPGEHFTTGVGIFGDHAVFDYLQGKSPGERARAHNAVPTSHVRVYDLNSLQRTKSAEVFGRFDLVHSKYWPVDGQGRIWTFDDSNRLKLISLPDFTVLRTINFHTKFKATPTTLNSYFCYKFDEYPGEGKDGYSGLLIGRYSDPDHHSFSAIPYGGEVLDISQTHVLVYSREGKLSLIEYRRGSETCDNVSLVPWIGAQDWESVVAFGGTLVGMTLRTAAQELLQVIRYEVNSNTGLGRNEDSISLKVSPVNEQPSGNVAVVDAENMLVCAGGEGTGDGIVGPVDEHDQSSKTLVLGVCFLGNCYLGFDDAESVLNCARCCKYLRDTLLGQNDWVWRHLLGVHLGVNAASNLLAAKSELPSWKLFVKYVLGRTLPFHFASIAPEARAIYGDSLALKTAVCSSKQLKDDSFRQCFNRRFVAPHRIMYAPIENERASVAESEYPVCGVLDTRTMEQHSFFFDEKDIKAIRADVAASVGGPAFQACCVDPEECRWFVAVVQGVQSPLNRRSGEPRVSVFLHVFKAINVKEAILGTRPYREASIQSHGWLDTSIENFIFEHLLVVGNYLVFLQIGVSSIRVYDLVSLKHIHILRSFGLHSLRETTKYWPIDGEAHLWIFDQGDLSLKLVSLLTGELKRSVSFKKEISRMRFESSWFLNNYCCIFVTLHSRHPDAWRDKGEVEAKDKYFIANCAKPEQVFMVNLPKGSKILDISPTHLVFYVPEIGELYTFDYRKHATGRHPSMCSLIVPFPIELELDLELEPWSEAMAGFGTFVRYENTYMHADEENRVPFIAFHYEMITALPEISQMVEFGARPK